MDNQTQVVESMEQTFTPADAKYPIDLEVVYPEKSSRLLALLTLLLVIPKLILLVPHLIVLYFVQIIAFFAWIFGQIAVLFTGKYPKALFEWVSGSLRWQARVNGYMMGLSDKYPPFKLK